MRQKSKRKLTGTVLLVEQVHKILELHFVEFILKIQKTGMVVDQDNQRMRLAHLGDVLSRYQVGIRYEEDLVGVGELEGVVLTSEEGISIERDSSAAMEELFVYCAL